MSWQAASYTLVALTVLAGFTWWERSRPSAKLLSLVAALSALAVLGRLAFTPIPNVKPTTDIAIFSGYALGPLPGFVVGATAALVSNFALGQGPWTPWEMAAWGITGVAGAALARVAGRDVGRWPLAIFCGAMGFLHGAIMDVFQTTVTGLQGASGWLAVSGTSFPFNLAHAVGNVIFCLLVGPSFVHAIARFRRRFVVRWEAPAAAACLALAAAAALAAPPRAEAASSAQRALSYVTRAQNSDGGFGAAPGQSSTQLYTGWAALGIAAAGRNPASVAAHGASPIAYMSDRSGQLGDIGELERTVLVLGTSGASPRSFRGRDLVAELVRRRKSSGNFDGTIDHAAFGILALRAAGAGVGRTAAWIARYQNSDGGFGFAPHGGSDPDDTGSVIQALVAAGRRGPVARAVAYLKRAQNRDGGWGQFEGRDSNAQSTAFAVQGLVAAGRDPSRGIRYLRSLQTSSGRVRYSRSSSQTPVWVTSQALLAMSRKAFPFRAPGRAAEHRKAAAVASGGSRAKRRRAKHAARAAKPRAKRKPALAAAPPPAGTPRSAALTRARSEAQSDRNGTDPWLLELALATLPIIALALWRRRWLQRRFPRPT